LSTATREPGPIRIAGLGAQTPVGRTVMSSWAAANAGITRVRRHPTAIDGEGRPVRVSMASYLPAELSLVDRLVELIVPAIAEALASLGSRDEIPRFEVPIFLCLPAPREDLPGALERELLARLRPRLEDLDVVGPIQTIRAGHAAGLLALERASRLVGGREASMCLIAAVDSYMAPETLAWLDQTGRLRTNGRPIGFRPGEGASACLLVSDSLPSAPRTLGRVVAAASVLEAEAAPLEGSEAPCALATAWADALRALPAGASVSHVVCDLNGEPGRATDFKDALMGSIARFAPSFSFLSPALSWGDVGAAAGLALLGVALAPCIADRAASTHCLLSASADGEERCACLVAYDP
jgi:3-oxoacyl-[acyl-carrier-protein] synthase I